MIMKEKALKEFIVEHKNRGKSKEELQARADQKAQASKNNVFSGAHRTED